MAVFLPFKALVINDMLAGRDTALQAEKKSIPMNTATQLVNITAMT